MDSLTALSTAELKERKARLRYDFRTRFAGVSRHVIYSHSVLRRDMNQMKWEIRRVDRELRKRTDATAPAAHVAAGQGAA